MGGIGGIVCSVEALQECIAQDELDTLITIVFADNEVDVVVATTNIAIESTRPDLGISCKSIGIL